MDKNLLFNLRKFLAPEIVYGEGALELAGRHALNFGAGKVLIVSDEGVKKAGWTAEVESSLRNAGLDYVSFLGVSPNPEDLEVMAGAKVYEEENCDLIIAVGGGSPMDCAKGIGVVATNEGSITDFEGVDEIPNPVPPLIFIPTTAGSSADVSQFAIITDTGRSVKIALISKMVIPDIALVDPNTTRSMPPELTAATGMDALCHAFEAYVSNASSPLTDMSSLRAVQLIHDNLVGAFSEPLNMRYRNNMMMASLMAGLAFSNASLGLVHAMAHSLGGEFDLPHGECNAILLEEVVKFNYPAAAEKYDQLGEAMGVEMRKYPLEERADVLSSAINSLRKRVGIRKGLEAMGVSSTDLPKLAEFAFHDPCLATNPCPATVEQIEAIYRSLYR